MGGAIAQTMAIHNASRVLSLTSMLSSTGNPSVGQPSPETMQALFAGPPAVTREEVVARQWRAVRLLGTSTYPVSEAEVADRAGKAFDRDYDNVALFRQAIASVSSPDRTADLAAVSAPALVIHGLEDRMCDVSGGQATANALPHSKLVLIQGLGHNLPPGVRALVVGQIAEVINRASSLNGHVSECSASRS